MSNVLRLAPWMMAIWAAVPVTPAGAQGNIDAGKTPAQIFGDTCSACHRSARELRRPSAGFLRTHYTTGSEEASAMANYLAGVASGTAQPKQPPRQQPAETPAAAAKQPPRQPPDQQPKATAQREQPKGRPSAAIAQARQAAAAVEERPPDPPPAPPAPVLEPFEE